MTYLRKCIDIAHHSSPLYNDKWNVHRHTVVTSNIIVLNESSGDVMLCPLYLLGPNITPFGLL